MAMDPKTREQMAGSAGIKDHKRFSDQQLRNLKAAQGRTRDRLMAKYLRENKEATAPKPKPRTQSSAPTSSSRPPSRPSRTSTNRATPEASRAREAHGRSRVERDSSTSPRPQPRPDRPEIGQRAFDRDAVMDDLAGITKAIVSNASPEEAEEIISEIDEADRYATEHAKTPAEHFGIVMSEVVVPKLSQIFGDFFSEVKDRHTVTPEWRNDRVTGGARERMPVPKGLDQPYVRRTVPNETLGQQIEEDRRLRIEAQSMFPRDLPPEQPQSYKKGGLVSRRKK